MIEITSITTAAWPRRFMRKASMSMGYNSGPDKLKKAGMPTGSPNTTNSVNQTITSMMIVRNKHGENSNSI